jgi:uncharacterized protein YycO
VLRTDATVGHRSPAFRLRPDALRLPNSRFIKNFKNSGRNCHASKAEPGRPKVGNLANRGGAVWVAISGAVWGGHQGELKLLDRQDSHSDAVQPVVAVKERVASPKTSYQPAVVEDDMDIPF